MKVVIKTNLIELEVTDEPIDSSRIGGGRTLPDMREAVKSLVIEAIKLHEAANVNKGESVK